MKHTLRQLDNSSIEEKKYYEKSIEDFTSTQKEELESLVIRLENAGAKKPLPWAMSEIGEGIPQFGRFLVLKSLFEIAKSTEDNVSLTFDFDKNMQDVYAEITAAVGEQKLLGFLTSFSKGIMYNVIELLDDGNLNIDKDKISWELIETDENLESKGKAISGLHESFLGFENEI